MYLYIVCVVSGEPVRPQVSYRVSMEIRIRDRDTILFHTTRHLPPASALPPSHANHIAHLLQFHVHARTSALHVDSCPAGQPVPPVLRDRFRTGFRVAAFSREPLTELLCVSDCELHPTTPVSGTTYCIPIYTTYIRVVLSSLSTTVQYTRYWYVMRYALYCCKRDKANRPLKGSDLRWCP